MFKKVLVTIISLAIFAGSGVVHAAADFVSVADLPAYTNTNSFDLSYTAYSEGSVSVKFYFRKDGNSYQQFGPLSTTPSGTVAVSGSQMSDQGKYFFKVELNGGTTDETSVTYDTSGPSPVSDYSKETLSPTHVKLNWRNPNDSDFWKVIIYRSTNSQFIADDNTKVADIVGPRDGVMSWEDAGQEAGNTYYYAIRAVDVAGNGSSLVSDMDTLVLGTTTTADDGTGTGGSTGTPDEVVDLPDGDGVGGRILGDEDEALDTEGSDESEDVQEVTLGEEEVAGNTSTLRRVLIVVAVVLFLLTVYRYFFRRKAR
jgi:hypothetical protein